MTLPTGKISIGDVRTELNLSGKLDLNNAIVRKLAAKPSGAISLGDLRGKQGNFSYTKTYTSNYPWTPPATQSFSGTLSSSTTTGTFAGTLSKNGAATNAYGAWADSGSQYTLFSDTTTVYTVGQQYGSTTISGAYEVKVVITAVNKTYVSNYVQHYSVYAKKQQRLITVNQKYTGTVYLRG